MGKLSSILLSTCLLASGLQAQTTPRTLTVLHSFSGADGSGPASALVIGQNGILFGTTTAGGAHGQGTVFSINAGGLFNVMHSFSGADAANPFGPLLYANNQFLYGMTNSGGTTNQGVIYQISPTGQFSVLHNFAGFDGNSAYGGLMQAQNGNLYGFTAGGGANGYGTVFRITLAGEYTVLYSFDYNDGAYPYGTPLDLGGGLYAGTTRRGDPNNNGTAFAVDDSGSITSIAYAGQYSQTYSGFVYGSNGNIFATTLAGGSGYGSVYQMDAQQNLTTVFAFNDDTGGFPIANVTVGQDGNLYGTATGGVLEGHSPYGSLYAMSQQGVPIAAYALTGTNGNDPIGGLVQAANGNFYGTTYSGGSRNLGVVYGWGTPPPVLGRLPMPVR